MKTIQFWITRLSTAPHSGFFFLCVCIPGGLSDSIPCPSVSCDGMDVFPGTRSSCRIFVAFIYSCIKNDPLLLSKFYFFNSLFLSHTFRGWKLVHLASQERHFIFSNFLFSFLAIQKNEDYVYRRVYLWRLQAITPREQRLFCNQRLFFPIRMCLSGK